MSVLVVKPTLEHYLKNGGYIRLAIAATFLTLLMVFGTKTHGMIVTIASAAILIGMTINLFLRRIILEDRRLTYIGWFGKRVSVPLTDIDHVVYASQYDEYNHGQTERIFFVKPSGGAYFSTVSLYWKGEGFNELVNYLEKHKVRIVREEEFTDSQYFIQKHRNITTYMERHPFALAWMIVGGFVVGYVIYFVLFELPKY